MACKHDFEGIVAKHKYGPVVMTYAATQDATCEGKKQTGNVFATSIWQKKGGKWLSPFHQETEAGSM
jgi:hypothetical protein